MDCIISVIIPVFNSEKYLCRCIESVICQLDEHCELILVDDGSTDTSGKICDSYSEEYGVKVIHKDNGGVSSARNVGIDAAQGSYIIFLDSDDRLAPDALHKIRIEIRQTHTDCLAWGIMQDSGMIWAPRENKIFDSTEDFKNSFPDLLRTELFSIVFNKLFKRDLIGRFDEEMSFGEDLYFCLDYLDKCSSVRFIRDRLYLHNNIAEGSLSKRACPGHFVDAEKIRVRLINFAPSCQKEANERYIRDIVCKLQILFRNNEYTTDNKISIIRQWYGNSYLRMINSNGDVGVKDRFMLNCIRRGTPFIKFFIWMLKLNNLLKGKR